MKKALSFAVALGLVSDSVAREWPDDPDDDRCGMSCDPTDW